MRYLTLLATAAALSFTAVPASFADNAKSDQCGRDRHCSQSQDQGNQHSDRKDIGDKSPARAQESRNRQIAQHNTPTKTQARKAPARGGDGAHGARVTRNANSKFGPAPRGQEYRLVDDHLVLVDSNSKRIQSVLGLMNDFRN